MASGGLKCDLTYPHLRERDITQWSCVLVESSRLDSLFKLSPLVFSTVHELQCTL
jgi:hypothetical protein